MSSSPGHPGQLIVLVGPSGVGKSTISRRLTESLKLTYALSATTREKRPGDEKGKTYEHINIEEFTRRLDADQFLEYAQVFGRFYGTPRHPTVDHLESGRDVLLEIDVQGALQVRYHYPRALLIFVLPPDEKTLLERLTSRGRDSMDEINARFREAKREIHMARGSKAFDHMVVNDDLDRAVKQIVDIIRH